MWPELCIFIGRQVAHMKCALNGVGRGEGRGERGEGRGVGAMFIQTSPPLGPTSHAASYC